MCPPFPFCGGRLGILAAAGLRQRPYTTYTLERFRACQLTQEAASTTLQRWELSLREHSRPSAVWRLVTLYIVLGDYAVGGHA